MTKLRLAPALFPLLVLSAGCSIGQGTGEVKSDALFAHDCWGTPPTMDNPTTAVGAPFNLQPDFFAADPYRAALQIRVQRGTDLTEVSDGLAVSIDDICQIRKAIGKPIAPGGVVPCPPDWGLPNGGPADGGLSDGGLSDGGPADGGADGGTGGGGAGGPAKWRVALPAGVHAPGSPTEPPPDALTAIVHMALYLNRSCHNENVVLYGLDGYITFNAIFDGDPTETSAADKLTDATFDVSFGDAHDAPAGSYAGDVPAGLQSRVTGNFRFYFERGQPAQPFP
jgi:hypothetical protein